MTPHRALRLALAAGLALAPALPGAQQPDTARGHELAIRWCADCHLVGPDGPGGDVAPAFVTLARARSDEALRGWIAEPHPPMPALDLSAMAVDEIAAYIRTLGACEATC